MTLEERFRDAAAKAVAVQQDKECLARQCAECEAHLRECQDHLREGLAVVAALMDATATEPGLPAELADRARAWMARIE